MGDGNQLLLLRVYEGVASPSFKTVSVEKRENVRQVEWKCISKFGRVERKEELKNYSLFQVLEGGSVVERMDQNELPFNVLERWGNQQQTPTENQNRICFLPRGFNLGDSEKRPQMMSVQQPEDISELDPDDLYDSGGFQGRQLVQPPKSLLTRPETKQEESSSQPPTRRAILPIGIDPGILQSRRALMTRPPSRIRGPPPTRRVPPQHQQENQFQQQRTRILVGGGGVNQRSRVPPQRNPHIQRGPPQRNSSIQRGPQRNPPVRGPPQRNPSVQRGPPTQGTRSTPVPVPSPAPAPVSIISEEHSTPPDKPLPYPNEQRHDVQPNDGVQVQPQSVESPTEGPKIQEEAPKKTQWISSSSRPQQPSVEVPKIQEEATKKAAQWIASSRPQQQVQQPPTEEGQKFQEEAPKQETHWISSSSPQVQQPQQVQQPPTEEEQKFQEEAPKQATQWISSSSPQVQQPHVEGGPKIQEAPKKPAQWISSSSNNESPPVSQKGDGGGEFRIGARRGTLTTDKKVEPGGEKREGGGQFIIGARRRTLTTEEKVEPQREPDAIQGNINENEVMKEKENEEKAGWTLTKMRERKMSKGGGRFVLGSRGQQQQPEQTQSTSKGTSDWFSKFLFEFENLEVNLAEILAEC